MSADLPVTSLQKTIRDGKNHYNSTNWILVTFGICGFIVSIFLLFGMPGCNGNRFHEININVKYADSVARGQLTTLLERHKKDTCALLSTKSAAATRDEKEIVRLNRHCDSLDELTTRLKTETQSLQYNNKDTLRGLIPRLGLHRNDLLAVLNPSRDHNTTLTYHYIAPEYSKEQMAIPVRVTSEDFETTQEFITKYPNYAFWLFLGMIFMVMCFLMIPICIAIYRSVNLQLKSLELDHRYWRNFWLASAGTVIFCFVVYQGLIDRYIADDRYFMQSIMFLTVAYGVVGYFVAILCFGGFLYIADLIHQLQAAYREGINKLTALVKTKQTEAGNDKEKLAVIEEDAQVKEQRSANERIKDSYKQAKKYFNVLVWMAALVLSVAVLWTGSLFSSINSMDVFVYYRSLTNSNYLSGDFVYLYGGLHTILLLIYVLPVKFKIYNMNMTIPELESGNGEGGTKQAKTVLSGVVTTLGNILLVTSPVLASFIENIIKSLFN